jgi:hypothetical protein
MYRNDNSPIFQFSIFILLALAIPSWSGVGPGTTIETMDGTIGSWDKIDWVDGSFTQNTTTNHMVGIPDSIRFLPGQLNVHEVYIGGVFHLQMDNVPSDRYLRLDASTYQHVFGSNLEHWGMAVVLYFDQDNWVAFTRIREFGGGYMSLRQIAGGTVNRDHGAVGYGADKQWRMHGIELTASNVNFYASPLAGPETFSSNNWDQLMSEDLSAMSFLRPPTFTGDATLIVGKGYSGDPDPWNAPWDFANPKTVAIDATRVIVGGTVVEENFHITDIAVTGSVATVSFNTLSGSTYHLESTTDFVPSAWADTGAFVDGDGGTKVLADATGASAEKNYRVATGAPDLGIHFVPVWDIDPYENYTRNRAPGPGTPPVQNIQVQLAQGEFRDALFMIGPPEIGQSTIHIQVDTFGGLPAEMILVQETLYVRNLTLNQPDTFTGDAVYPLTGPLVVPPGESRQVRLRFDARYSGVQPGVYPFQVIISDAHSSDQVTIPGTVEVWDFALPGIDELPSHNWVQIKATSWSGQVLENGIQEMKKYGPNYIYVSHTELPMATIVDTSGNILSMNYNSFDYRVSSPLNAWQAGAGSESLKYVFYLYDLTLGQAGGGPITYPSSQWNTLFADWISRMRNRLQTNYGIGNDRWILVLGDEVGEQTLMDYVIPLAETIKSIDPTIRLNSNSSVILAEPWASRYYAAFDIFQPNLQYVESNPAMLTFLQASGKELWTYKAAGYCGSVGFDVYRYYRSYAWRMEKYGMMGIGLWTYCANQGGAAQYDWPGYNPAGIQTSLGHILVWQHWANNDIVHCRRYEMYRETTDDYRYILKLRDVAQRAGAQAQTDAEALIDQATTDIINNNWDHTRCETWRKAVAAEILTLQN